MVVPMSPFPSIAACLALGLAAMATATPTLHVIGDSTVRNSTEGQRGWGDPLVRHFDPAQVTVSNRAIGGRSSRTFLAEGRWDAVLAHLRPGDHVLIQFGHNDGGPINDGRARASLRGNGDESEMITRKSDGKQESVRTYGWYLRKYAEDAKARGAVPIIVSPVPRNLWKNGAIQRDDDTYSRWAREAAAQAGARFIPLHDLLADAYTKLGEDRMAELFATNDHTHHRPAGAEFNAAILAAAIRTLPDCTLGTCLLPADLWLPHVFSDHMVLQRGRPVPVWGSTTPGGPVVITLDGRETRTQADAHGRWMAHLPSMQAGGPFTMEITAGTARRRFEDVLIGEVWLCSGQSNMDFTLGKTTTRPFAGVTAWEREVAAAEHPRIRMFTAAWSMNEFPQQDVDGQWRACSPETAAEFSAVAFYFGRTLERELDVPVGLLTCAYGASTIEAWIRRDTLAAKEPFRPLLTELDRKVLAFRDKPQAWLDYGKALATQRGGRAPKNPDPFQDQHHPAVLHNGMLAPVAPYALRGTIWYQGESNLNTRQLYPELQASLIHDLRELWLDPRMPFLFTQLAAYRDPRPEPSSGQIAEMREAQAASLAIAGTGMAVTIDIGDAKDIHPRNKRDVGERLARLALSGTYSKGGTPCGPTLREATIESGRIRLRFDHAEDGLLAKDGPLRHFAIAGEDRKFVWADARIDGHDVLVSHPSVPAPAHVRYGWADHPAGANLCNTAGLPAAPFRTDR